MVDSDSLLRFLEAQEIVFSTVLDELRRGQKRTHWMWFIFPQLRILGRSERAIYFGIRDVIEARSYAAHPILGARLLECAQAVLTHPNRSIVEVMGQTDAIKLRSSATLFANTVADHELNTAMAGVLRQFYGDKQCTQTLATLNI